MPALVPETGTPLSEQMRSDELSSGIRIHRRLNEEKSEKEGN
jgi:hypothetical protein